MFANSSKIAVLANRLATKNNSYRIANEKCSNALPTIAMGFHSSSCAQNYMLPIPHNIDPAESTRFSPNRARDISATVILSHYGTPAAIDITADNSTSDVKDPHTESYDCFGAVSLNSAMQSNVPTPFGGMHKFSHLNMPGGQWSQEPKFTSQNLHSSHYTALRDSARAGWISYNQDATVHIKELAMPSIAWRSALLSKRSYCSKVEKKDDSLAALTRGAKLKRAFKDYGATVVVFHVSISLLSLGGCYLLVSGGVNLVPMLEYFGLASSALHDKIATASTFVVAYAIHKIFAPVRVSITLGVTPFIVRYLRSKGILKANIVKPK